MTNRAFTVGRWTVRPSRNRLERDGTSVAVEPKLIELLSTLASRPGETFSRDELLAACWPDQIACDHVLTRAISELRSALSDDPRRPRYIETIRKRGYRLVAPVAPGPETRRAATTSRRPSRHRVWRLAAALFLAALPPALWYATSIPRVATNTRPPLTTEPLTALRGMERDPAIAPDGRAVAFVWHQPDGRDDLYVQSLLDGRLQRLTDTPGTERSPAWSPDGRTLAFLRQDDEVCGVWLLEVKRVRARRLRACNAPRTRGLAWHPDPATGLLVMADRDVAGEPLALWAVDVHSGSRHRLTAPSATVAGDFDPAFSPDGSRIAFIRSSGYARHDVFVVASRGGTARRLTTAGHPIEGIAWRPDGRALAVSTYAKGRAALQLVGLDEDGAARTQLLPGARPAWSPAGDALVFESRTVDDNIWRVSLAADPAPAPAIASTLWDSDPDVSPDGALVAFVSDRSGSPEIWVGQPDGRQARRLTELAPAAVRSPRWSPDGLRIAFSTRREAQADIWTVDVRTGELRRVTTSPADDEEPAWAPAGDALVFTSDRDGHWALWQARVDGGPIRRVTDTDAINPRISADARWVYYAKADDAGLWRRPLAGGSETRITAVPARGDGRNWSLAPWGLLALVRTDAGSSLVGFDADGGSRRVVAELPLRLAPGGMALAPDGATAYLVHTDRRDTDLRILRLAPQATDG